MRRLATWGAYFALGVAVNWWRGGEEEPRRPRPADRVRPDPGAMPLHPLAADAEALADLDELTIQTHQVYGSEFSTLVGKRDERVVWSTTWRRESA